MIVRTDINGSRCVVFKTPGRDGPYIDAKPDPHLRGIEVIEVVRNGHVCDRVFSLTEFAPATIINLMRTL
jgi:hypothetical protein